MFLDISKDPAICATCYWASPEDYDHVAMRQVRRLDVVWEGKEIADFQTVAKAAEENKEPMPEFVKRVLRQAFHRKKQ